jgi:ATP diphosphatase
MIASNMYSFDKLLKIMEDLRDPISGCPWDIEQTFETIMPYTIEEAYEVSEAITNHDYINLKQELGDLLLQVVFQAQIAKDRNLFDMSDVIDAICSKMINRHPHVFSEPKNLDLKQQQILWEEQKSAERAHIAKTENISALAGVSAAYPALIRSQKLQQRASGVGFDWNDASKVIEKVEEELEELQYELNITGNKRAIEEELGDLLFSCVNLARHLDVDAETALHKANKKFSSRFEYVETLLSEEKGIKPKDATLKELENLWNIAKAKEVNKKNKVEVSSTN